MRPIDWIAVTALLLFAAGLRMIGISYGQLNPDYFPSTAPLGMVHEQAPIQPDEFFNDNILGKFYTKDFEAIEFKDPLEISNL